MPGTNTIRAFCFSNMPVFRRIRKCILILSFPFSCLSQQVYIGSGAGLIMQGRPFLVVNNASLINHGSIISDSGIFKITGSTDTAISFIGGNSLTLFNHLVVDKTSYGVALKSPVSVKDSIKINKGILYSNGFLTLKSNSTKTATLASLPVDASGVATAYIAGKVTIERYLKARRAWRLLSAPLLRDGSPTINQAWQEGVTSGNPNSGYGLHIVGGSVANGYDISPTANSSVKVYDTVSNNLVALPPVTGTHLPIANYKGYFVFAIGNRSTDIFNPNAPATSTTLRMKGAIKAGDQTVSVNPFKHTVMGNPFPASIDFGLIVKNNVRNAFYAWDPMLAGTYGVGGWVTVSWNGASYDATANASTITECIPSGSAVLVQSGDSATAGSVIIKESSKTSCGSQGPLARNGLAEKLSILLMESNSNGSKGLMDAVLTNYADHYLNERDEYDAIKYDTKYIGLKRGSNLFSIERRKTITVNDTVFLNLSSLSIRNYQLNFIITNMQGLGLQAILQDNYSTALNGRLLNMNDSNAVEFQVNSDPASYAANRFSVVFSTLIALPAGFVKVTASKKDAGILVQWDVQNNVNTKDYVLEKSANGINFYTINVQTAKGLNPGTTTYEYIDEEMLEGNNFYRVRSVSAAGVNNFCNIVKVQVELIESSLSIYPNPIKNNRINLLIGDEPTGIYNFRFLSVNGQVVQTGKFFKGSPLQKIQLTIAEKLPPGVYQLEVTSPKQARLISKIVVN